MAAASLAAVCGGACSSGGSAGQAPLPAAALAQFASCDDLRTAIVSDARGKIELQAARLRSDGWAFAEDRDVFTDGPGVSPAPAPEGFTDTNTQVPGVDEADVVETDGAHLYLLHGAELLVLDSWPPEATSLRARVAIEGSPIGMFVDAGRAVVLSHVYDAGSLGGDDACAWIDGPLPVPRPLVGASVDDGIAPCAPSFTKLTLIDLSAETPRVAREIFTEGTYTAARRHGDRVRVVVQRGWGLPPGVPEPWQAITSPEPPTSAGELARRVDAWEAQALAAIDASALEDWLPTNRERVAGALVEVPVDCADVFVPPAGLAEHGATSILALRMSEDAGAVEESLVLGGASQVYASADTLLLAQPDWAWLEHDQPNDRTAVHVFALPDGGLETAHRASGFVPGTTLSQLAFDVRGEVIRVATTVTPRDAGTPGGGQTTSRITTARVAGEGLEILGQTPDLAPGERVFAARFLDDRGFLVTFRSIDPLFVVDLSDPARPTVLGEVELPGFSQYIHPLDARHLLTIGRDADPEGGSRGVALRIFDVADPAAPRLTHSHVLPGDGWSAAESDHLAFTFSPELGVLAIPYTRYDGEYRSSLVVLGVDATRGFSPRGEVDHGGFAVEGCPSPGPDPVPPAGPVAPDLLACPVLPEMRRGLLIESNVYSISSGGVLVNALADLAVPLAAVPLPPPSDPPVAF